MQDLLIAALQNLKILFRRVFWAFKDVKPWLYRRDCLFEWLNLTQKVNHYLFAL